MRAEESSDVHVLPRGSKVLRRVEAAVKAIQGCGMIVLLCTGAQNIIQSSVDEGLQCGFSLRRRYFCAVKQAFR